MKFIFFLWTLLKIVLNLKSASLCLNNEHCHRLKVTLNANLYLCPSSRHRLKTSTQLLQWFKIGFERETHLTWLLWLYEVKVANCNYGQWTLMVLPLQFFLQCQSSSFRPKNSRPTQNNLPQNIFKWSVFRPLVGAFECSNSLPAKLCPMMHFPWKVQDSTAKKLSEDAIACKRSKIQRMHTSHGCNRVFVEKVFALQQRHILSNHRVSAI